MSKIEVKVLGLGCSSCKELYRTAIAAVAQLSAQEEVEVEKVENIQTIMQYGALSMPALVVNGKIKVSGRSPTVGEVVSILATELMSQ